MFFIMTKLLYTWQWKCSILVLFLLVCAFFIKKQINCILVLFIISFKQQFNLAIQSTKCETNVWTFPNAYKKCIKNISWHKTGFETNIFYGANHLCFVSFRCRIKVRTIGLLSVTIEFGAAPTPQVQWLSLVCCKKTDDDFLVD